MCIRKILFFFVSVVSIHMVNAEEMIDYLHEWFEERPYEQYGTCEDIKELKYPSQEFVHFLKMEIKGVATVRKERRWWFDSDMTLTLNHRTDLILAEEVLTSSNLDEGIIKSKFTIQLINEALGEVGYSYKFLGLSSNGCWKKLKTLGEKTPNWIQYMSVVWIPSIYAENDKNVNSSGEFVIDKEKLEKLLPEYKQLVTKLRDFKGVEVTTTWELGKGYTSVAFNEGGKEKLGEDTANAIAKLIYRTNPISIKEVLPDDKCQGDCWTIDANAIGGLVFDLGLVFDDVTGQIDVVYSADKQQKFEDEISLLKKPLIATKHISIPKSFDSELRLEKYGQNQGTVIKFSPVGKFYIIDEVDANERRILYLKEAELQGKLESKIDNKYRTGLLKAVEFKNTDLDIQINYTQVRKN